MNFLKIMFRFYQDRILSAEFLISRKCIIHYLYFNSYYQNVWDSGVRKIYNFEIIVVYTKDNDV